MNLVALAKKRLKRIRKKFRLCVEVWHDSGRYFRSGNPAAGMDCDEAIIEGEMIRNYHVIEKGLSMPEFRPGFGAEPVARLVEIVESWVRNKRPENNAQFDAAKAVLVAYRKRHIEIGHAAADRVPADLNMGDVGGGGIKIYSAGRPSDLEGFERTVRTRSSVRSFIPDKLPDRHIVNQAIDDARWAPSVCNRQTVRVHLYTGEKATEILRYQSGNRGFGHRVPLLIIVTSDLRYFSGVSERYQGWIDGGMFSMLLLLGLHARGVGAVALNWSVLNKVDRAVRQPAGIPDHERIIMMIGCGIPDSACVVPFSRRRSVEEISRWH